MLKRIVPIGLAVMLSTAIAFAIPTDARTTTQFSVTPSTSFVGPPGADGRPTSASTTINSPSRDNGANGPNGIVFCTLKGDDCLPINKQSCDPAIEKRRLEFTLTSVPGTIPINSIARVFPSANGNCTWTGSLPPKSPKDQNYVFPQDTSGPITTGNPILNGNQAWNFPGNVPNAQLTTVNALANAILACDDTGINNARYVFCIAFDLASGGSAPDGVITDSDAYAQATFLVDTVPPEAPSTFIVTGGDRTLNLTIGQPSDNNGINIYHIRYRVAADENLEADPNDDCSTWTDFKESSPPRRGAGAGDDAWSTTVDGVPNGYLDVCAGGEDLAGNVGPFSKVVRAITHAECDFISCYPDEPPTGYCGSIPPSMLAMWIAVPLFARRRFRRSALLAAPLVFAVFIPSTAKATLEPPSDLWISETTSNAPKRPSFGVELRMGPMRPTIGSPAAQEIFNKVFDGKTTFKGKPMMLQFEFDWYLFNRYGLGGVFGRVGHWRASGHTRNCATDAEPTRACTPDIIDESVPNPSSKTSLTVFPLTAGLIYKFDVIKETTWVPLVPYVKGGLDWYLWSNTINGKASTASDGSKGHGGQFGVNGSLGLALNLNWIDQDAARNARTGAGISDTYLFFEWTGVYGKIRSQSLDFSASYFLAGLSLDFI